MISTESPPTTSEQLLAEISREFSTLSRQLKAIANYVETHREHLGIEGIQQVANACDVQPSAVVRFAKHFGFSGFTEMQKLFRAAISQQIAPARNYQDRIQDVIREGGALASTDIVHQFLAGSIAGMQQLQTDLVADRVELAVDLLARADSVWLIGMRRSFPVAAYLEYAMQQTGKRALLLSGVGGMQEVQLRSLRKDDVMLAISFAPYAQETLDAAQIAQARGARLIAITDSRMSPLAQVAEVVLTVQENSPLGFRSLTNTLGLAQGLFIALAYRLELSAGKPAF